MGLTDTEFWDDYWSNVRLPVVVDPSSSFDRCLAAFLSDALAGRRGDLLEVGCAPGKWLAFFASLGFCPSGIEYSPAGLAATERNLALLGVEYGLIMNGDFFSLAPQARFDVVASFGFLEHFDDPDAVVERHLAWLRPGGLLVLGVPNFRGLHGAVQRMIDAPLLEKHNLATMDVRYFRHVAERFGLTERRLEYIGSFEPALPRPSPNRGSFARVAIRMGIGAATRVRRIRAFDRLNSPRLSSYLVFVGEKGA